MGIKHSGKTSLGKLLANTLDVPFMDLDALLEEKYSKDRRLNFRDLYLKLGESGFRNLETAAIQNTIMSNRGILALGGGTIDNQEAMRIVKEASLLVFLDVDEKILYERIKKNGFPPFLEKSPEKLFHELFSRRRFLYSEIADIKLEITNETPEGLLNILINRIEDSK
jgi:shikimate kinase